MTRSSLVRKNSATWERYVVPTDTSEFNAFVELLASERPGRLLDLGCADGTLASAAKACGWIPTGADGSLPNANAATRAGIFSFHADFEERLPLPDGAFDAVVLKQVIEHVLDTGGLLKECHRVLRPEGVLLLSTPNLASLSNRLRLAAGKYPGWMDFDYESGIGHVRYYTKPVLVTQLESLGFSVDQVLGNALALPLLGRAQWLDRVRVFCWAGRRVPSLAPTLIVKARKK